MLKEIAYQIREILKKVEPELSLMNETEAGLKPSPEEWSKKEIIGHLIDSAANNHQRFVRAAYGVAWEFPTYDQIQWVTIQRYNEIAWGTLIALWAALNNHLSHVIECLPDDAESSPCNIGEAEPAPLNFIIKDYVHHLNHHINDLMKK